MSDRIGGFDILINNATIIVKKRLEQFSVKEYREQLRINSTAACILSKLNVTIIKKNVGNNINFTSVNLNEVVVDYIHYVESKGAILGLTRSLAIELGSHDICAYVIEPGAVTFEAEERVFSDKAEEYRGWV